MIRRFLVLLGGLALLVVPALSVTPALASGAHRRHGVHRKLTHRALPPSRRRTSTTSTTIGTKVLSLASTPSAWKGVNWGDPWGMWCWTGTGGYALSSCRWAGITSDLADMQAAGVTWARTDLYQNVDSSFYAQLFPLFARYGLQALVIIHKSDPANGIGTSSQQSTYQSWLGSTVDSYKSYVRVWEVQNEENISSGWSISESTTNNQAYAASVASYVTDLKESYQTIKAHDSTATVALGGVSDDYGIRFIDQLEADGASRWMDVFAYHPYESSPTNVVSRVQSATSELAKQPTGLGSKPFWITEVGFYCTSTVSTFSRICDETARAQGLTQTMNDLHGAGITTPIVWYELHSHGASTSYGGYGLELKSSSTYATTPLPTYTALKNL